MPDIHVHDPRLRRSVRSHDLAVECKIISTIYGPIMEFSSCPNSCHYQGPASVGRLIAFWVLLRQQLLNLKMIFFFVSAVNAQLCHVIKKKKFNRWLLVENINLLSAIIALSSLCKMSLMVDNFYVKFNVIFSR